MQNIVTDTLKIAVIQFSPIWENAAENRRLIDKLLLDLPLDTELVILPEAFNTGFSMNHLVTETMDGETITWMKSVAINNQIAICGSLFVAENGNFYNRFCWFYPNGELVTYNKRHLFNMGNEDQFFTKGEKQTIIECKGWKIVPQICYDLRFPVWSRNSSGYHILVNVANWPMVRSEVWNTLLKARAIENQCYVVASNRTGTDGAGLEYQGESQVIDYKGKVISSTTQNEAILINTLHKNDLTLFRSKFDTLKDADNFVIG